MEDHCQRCQGPLANRLIQETIHGDRSGGGFTWRYSCKGRCVNCSRLPCMVEGMARLARNLGSDGEVGNVEWTTLADSRALQIDMESQTRERFARTIKAKHGGYDHFIGMYVEPSSQRKELSDLFEEFLDRYGGER